MRKNVRKYIVIGLLAMLVTVFMASQAQAVYWKTKYSRFMAIAGETLVEGDIVYLSTNDGYAYKADADDATKRPAVGIIGKGGAAASKVEVVTEGILGGNAALSAGLRLFLGTAANTFTVTATGGAGTYLQALGWVIPTTPDGAVSSGDYYVKVQMPAISTGENY